MISQEPAYFNLGVSGDETKKNYFSLFPEEMIASVLDAFIINKPMAGKVGGDGFWVHQESDYLYIAVFDCMGHGHMASMMTRVYIQSLNRVVETNGIKDPGAILENLHDEIAKKFKGKDNLQIGSGADIGILKINLSVRMIEFAGAKIDLLHFKSGELDIVKSDRLQIGDLWDYDHKYSTKEVSLENGVKSNFYLSSDGFKDLIGGPEDKKLGKKGVTDLLQKNFGKPLLKQKEDILSFVEDWSGSSDQLDDVLIIGFAI